MLPIFRLIKASILLIFLYTKQVIKQQNINMSSNTEYYQPPTRMWDSIYDEAPNAGHEDPCLTDQLPLFPDENVTFFCFNCNMQVGAYLREDYHPVCDRCFGEFIEVVRILSFIFAFSLVRDDQLNNEKKMILFYLITRISVYMFVYPGFD